MIHICEGNVGEASADATHTYIIYEGTPSCGKERRQRAKLPAVRTTFLPPALAMRLPRAGNAIAKGRQCDCQGPAMRLPRAGNAIAKGWQCDCQGPALDVPAAGTRCTRGWHLFLCKKKFPRPLGTQFPAAGNMIPKGWEHDSQPLGTRFPAAGNSIPKSRGKIIMCTSAAAIRARSTKTRNRDFPAGKPRLMSVEQ